MSKGKGRERTSSARSVRPAAGPVILARPNPRAEPIGGPEDLQLVDLELKGTVRAVLTWNLPKRAFLESDGSRERFQLLRGGREFARFLRGLKERVADSSFFRLDPGYQDTLAIPYSADLLTQYVIDYEYLPSYLVTDGLCPTFTFDDETAGWLERLGSGPPGFREALEHAGRRQLEQAWSEWPIKRLRLSRYGFLQVVLERRFEDFVTATKLVTPLTHLYASMGLQDLSQAAKDRGDLARALAEIEDPDARRERSALEMSVQWEIVGRILSWLIQAVHGSSTAEDSFHFDPEYRVAWQKRRAHVGGRALPLRARFFTIHVDGARRAHRGSRQEVLSLNPEERLLLARLLEGTPLVQQESEVHISPQRKESLLRVLEHDDATWDGEACFLSYDTAVLVGLHASDLVVRQGSGLPYGSYWPIVARTFEYLAELQQAARFAENVSSDWLEDLMQEVARKGGLLAYEASVRFTGATASLVARLRNAAAPGTISQNEALLSKISRLSSILRINNSLDHAERNLSAIQRLVSHAERSQNEQGVLKLTVGLAAFTAVLMGLALPPYYHYSLDAVLPPHLRSLLSPGFLVSLAEIWGDVALVLTVIALATAGLYCSRLIHLRQLAKRAAQGCRRWVGQRRENRLSRRAVLSRRRCQMAHTLSLHEPEDHAAPTRVELVRSHDGETPAMGTTLEVAHRRERLCVRFDCRGLPDPRVSNLPQKRDEPLWDGEIVQVVLAPGRDVPERYVEIEVSPSGAIFDAIIVNPTGLRSCMAFNTSWDCRGLKVSTGRGPDSWWAEIEIPLEEILAALGRPTQVHEPFWVANFYRIHRPAEGAAEFTAWSPTQASPADFHRPDRFGILHLLG